MVIQHLPVCDMPNTSQSAGKSCQVSIDGSPVPLISLFSGAPIEHIPNLGQVFFLVIPVLQIVRMLPHVDAEDGQLASCGQILVLRCRDLESAADLGLDEPDPSRSLDRECGGLEGGLEGFEAAPSLQDVLMQLRRGRCQVRVPSRLWGEVFPEEGMVHVASSVEFDGRLQFELLDEVASGKGFGGVFQGLVEIGDVGLVMFVVVQVHDLPGNRGL